MMTKEKALSVLETLRAAISFETELLKEEKSIAKQEFLKETISLQSELVNSLERFVNEV